MCSFHTPPSYFSYKLFIPFLSHICLPPLFLLTPPPLSPPLPPPPLSLPFSTFISSNSFFFTLVFTQLVYCSGKVCEIPNLHRLPPSYHRNNWLTFGLLLLAMFTIGEPAYSITVCSVLLCQITSPITHTLLWLESLSYPLLPSSYISFY